MTDTGMTTEDLLFKLERQHALNEQEQEEKVLSMHRELQLANKALDEQVRATHLATQRGNEIEDELMTQKKRLKPTLFGSFMGGLLSGVILTTIIGTYVWWAAGSFS